MTISFVPTMEGQYIIKNLVLITAGLVVGATVRGGHIAPEPLRLSGTTTSGRGPNAGDR